MSRAIKTIRYASRQTGVNFEKILTWGAIGVGLYLGLQVLGLVKGAKDALATAGGAIGSGLYSILHPNELGEMQFHVALFPDGVRHSIPSSAVSPGNGTFTNYWPSNPLYRGDGKRYKLVRDDKGVKRAIPL